jgi:hypothetical protein
MIFKFLFTMSFIVLSSCQDMVSSTHADSDVANDQITFEFIELIDGENIRLVGDRACWSLDLGREVCTDAVELDDDEFAAALLDAVNQTILSGTDISELLPLATASHYGDYDSVIVEGHGSYALFLQSNGGYIIIPVSADISAELLGSTN